MVVADGRLYWIYDAYTTSNRYPYSTRTRGGLNYIRNSVKFVIDAYQGTTTAYLADPGDPIAATYNRIFPMLFRPLSDMPASIRAHVRYPEDIFALQSRMFATYHMTQPSVFYNRVSSLIQLSENRPVTVPCCLKFACILSWNRIDGLTSMRFLPPLSFTTSPPRYAVR